MTSGAAAQSVEGKQEDSPQTEKYVAPAEDTRDRKEEGFKTLDECLRAELFGKPKVYIDVAGEHTDDDGASVSITSRSDQSSDDPDYEPDSAEISRYYDDRSTTNTDAASTEPTTASEADTEGTCICYVTICFAAYVAVQV